MIGHVKLDDRLSILCAGEIWRFPGGRYKLYCPTLGCPSGPYQWLYPRAPVVSEIAEPDWWRAGTQPARCPAESTQQARGHVI